MPWKGKNQVEKRSGKRNAKIAIFVFPPTILRLSSLSFAFSPLWRFVTYEKSSSTWLIWFFKKAKIHVVTFLYQSIGTRLTTLNRCGKESGKKNVGANYFTLINNVRIIEMKITISFSYFLHFSSPYPDRVLPLSIRYPTSPSKAFETKNFHLPYLNPNEPSENQGEYLPSRSFLIAVAIS